MNGVEDVVGDAVGVDGSVGGMNRVCVGRGISGVDVWVEGIGVAFGARWITRIPAQ
jgi:hypothetical protein